MSDTTKITQIKLIKAGEKLQVGFEETGDNPSVVPKKIFHNRCHPDLIRATNALAVHLAIMTEYIPEKNAHKSDLLERFIVTGYSIGGKEGEEGLVITGYRKLKSGKTVTLNTAFTRFEEDDKTRYILMSELEDRLKEIEKEVILYMTKAKKGEDPQSSLDFPEEEDGGDEKPGAGVVRMQVARPVGSEGGNLSGEGQRAVAAAGVRGPRKGGRKRQQTADNPAGD